MGYRSFIAEWAARRSGRRGLTSDLSRSAREVIGPTGWMWSRGWDMMAKGSSAYTGSFDKRLPPSLFVSERDRTRHNIPIPLVERCVEDWEGNDAMSENEPWRNPQGVDGNDGRDSH